MGRAHSPGKDQDLEINPEHRSTIELIGRISMVRRISGILLAVGLTTMIVADLSLQWNPTETIDDWMRGDGDPSSHVFSEVHRGTRQPVAYDPCQPVRYVVNPGDAPEELRQLLDEAVVIVEEHTGLDFVFEDDDAEAKVEGRSWYMPEKYGERWSPVLVSFTDPAEFPLLEGTVLGGAQSLAHTDVPYYVTGSVIFDAPELVSMLGGSRGDADVRATMVHELSHLVGLDHVDDDSQLMYEANQGQTTLGAGDREGLKLLGEVPCASPAPVPSAAAPR